MQTWILFVAALLVTSSYAVNNYTADTPNILIGNWTVSLYDATSSSPCCQPTGDLTIINNGDDSVTLTSANWTGITCGTRNSSFQELIYVDGSDSFNQLQNTYGELPLVHNGEGIQITIEISFSSEVGTTMSLVYNDYISKCYTYFYKSAEVMSVFGVILIGCLNLIIA